MKGIDYRRKFISSAQNQTTGHDHVATSKTGHDQVAMASPDPPEWLHWVTQPSLPRSAPVYAVDAAGKASEASSVALAS